MTTEPDAVLKNARPEYRDVRSPNVWGHIHGDRKGRFTDGEAVYTSTVLAIEEDGQIIRTRNSVYRVEWAPGPEDQLAAFAYEVKQAQA